VLAAEAAWALGDLALQERPAVLPACRRLLEAHPSCGPLWWVAARMLTAGDPVEEATFCVEALESDPTADLLEEDLAGVRRVVRHGGVGEVAGAEVVVVEVDAVGPGGMVVDGDDTRLLEAARSLEVPVWIEAGVGCVMPPRLWEALAAGVGHGARQRVAVVGLDGVACVGGPAGVQSLAVALQCGDCPEPSELLGRA
jgi:hypothetical protein